jgi:hypothetical protein
MYIVSQNTIARILKNSFDDPRGQSSTTKQFAGQLIPDLRFEGEIEIGWTIFNYGDLHLAIPTKCLDHWTD